MGEHGYERAAILARAVYVCRWHGDYELAEEMLAPHLHEMWAKVLRLRLAMLRKNRCLIRIAADDLLSVGPTQSSRVEAGRGYAMAGEYHWAKEVFVGVARDPGAPPLLRTMAYRRLMKVVGGALGEWPTADELHQEWVKLAPGDPGVSQWAPTIATRLKSSA